MILTVLFFPISCPSNSKEDAPFHCRSLICYYPDWNSLLIFWPWKDIFELGTSDTASRFVSWSKWEFMYIFVIKNMCYFFISNTFISNTRVKLAKNQENGKQHPEAELLLFNNYSYSSFLLLSRNNRIYSKK